MISLIFTIIGLWVVMMIVTFVFVCSLAHSLNRKWISDRDETALAVSLITFVVFIEFLVSIKYVIFKNHPEEFGYTRIEQEVETEVTDE